MKPYSMDLRERVVTACDQGQQTHEQIAQRFQVSTAWIRRLLQRRRDTGSFAPLPQNPGRKPALDGAGSDRLRQLVQHHPDATLAELQRGLGLTGSLGVVWRGLRRLGLTRKKSRGGRLNRTAPTSKPSAKPGRGTSATCR